MLIYDPGHLHVVLDGYITHYEITDPIRAEPNAQRTARHHLYRWPTKPRGAVAFAGDRGVGQA
jgi:hypothetical protein